MGKKELETLRDDLLRAQSELQQHKAGAVAFIISGMPAAGRSETVNTLLEWVDPKHVTVKAYPHPDREDRKRPPLWRYWQALPAKGRMTIFFSGWYGELLGREGLEHEGKPAAVRRAVERVRRLETMLARDGVVVLKIHLHVDEAIQRERLAELRADKLTRWRVTAEDEWLARHRRKVSKAEQRIIKATDHAAAPWHRIDGSDEDARVAAVAKLVRDALRKAVQHLPPAQDAEPSTASTQPITKMPRHAPAEDLSKDEYERELQILQGRFALLARRKRFLRHGLVLVFEGMDAAGKGGAIRRLTHALDARQYQVVPVSAPTPEELAHPYLWRFWKEIPELGYITIFDRSWYGRVLVERVRGFAAIEDWRRAYDEIAELERQLTEHGLIVAKFWLQLGKEEQLERFRAREEDPLKRFKVDRQDWVNREYYDAYQNAAAEMIRRTDAPAARWHVIPADDKKYARIAVLRAVCEAIEERLAR